MPSLGLLLVFLLVTVPPLQPFSLPPPDTPEGKAAIANLVLSALERATSFLKKRLSEINLDGVVGLRVLEEFELTIQPGFWKLPCTCTLTNTSLVYSTFETQDSFSKESIDLCLVQLLGTSQNEGMHEWAVPPEPALHESLLHQHVALNRRAEAIGYAYPTRDIFMENIMFCGIGGFSDFYKLRWLAAILSWQKPQGGCFRKPDGCSSHNTAMALGALGGFLYALAEYLPAQGEL
ncbi:hypothetical protein MUG91_G139n40 [Manis pentadactyla]|nr:hypothetical protein MUG91_G139n40 [Manis pentadactyla]